MLCNPTRLKLDQQLQDQGRTRIRGGRNPLAGPKPALRPSRSTRASACGGLRSVATTSSPPRAHPREDPRPSSVHPCLDQERPCATYKASVDLRLLPVKTCGVSRRQGHTGSQRASPADHRSTSEAASDQPTPSWSPLREGPQVRLAEVSRPWSALQKHAQITDYCSKSLVLG